MSKKKQADMHKYRVTMALMEVRIYDVICKDIPKAIEIAKEHSYGDMEEEGKVVCGAPECELIDDNNGTIERVITGVFVIR